MKKRNRKRASAGFSLLEVVAAIAVLGIVVTAVSTSLVSSIQFNARAEQRLQAELAVANAVERFRALGYENGYDYAADPAYANVMVLSDPDLVNANPNPDQEAEYKIVGYTLTIQSAEVPSLSVTTYARVKEAGS